MPAPDLLWQALQRFAEQRPQQPALSDERQQLCYAELPALIDARAAQLQQAGSRCVALTLGNGVDWLLWDLAILRAGLVCVPVPPFFTPVQRQHLLQDAGVDCLLGPAEAAELQALGFQPGALGWQRAPQPVSLPPGTAKITYTSGSTGTAKGVCLSASAMLRVAEGLAEATAPVTPERHLTLLPLAVLLDNIAAWAALLSGAHLHVPQDSGVHGSQLRPQRLLQVLQQALPHSLILVPQLLQALLQMAEAGTEIPSSLRFIAVGGGHVAAALLARAAQRGWPVFEGYGLSECASVVSLNRPGAQRPGSVGQVLAPLQLRIAEDGEIHVRGSGFLGYLGEPQRPDDEWPTGDIGRLEDGYLRLLGRKKNQFITAFGRNVNPEWVEAELTAQPAIAQALVYGEALPRNLALLVPCSPAFGLDAMHAAVAAANRQLPDYAQISHWLIASQPFSTANGLLTGNGRLRRDAIIQHYRPALLGLLTEEISA